MKAKDEEQNGQQPRLSHREPLHPLIRTTRRDQPEHATKGLGKYGLCKHLYALTRPSSVYSCIQLYTTSSSRIPTLDERGHEHSPQVCAYYMSTTNTNYDHDCRLAAPTFDGVVVVVVVVVEIDRKSRFLKIEDRVPAQKIEANRFRTVPGAGNSFKH